MASRHDRDRPETGLGPLGNSETSRRGLDKRGLSDLIGFVLTFGVILASVALASMYGLDALGQFQQNEQVNNAERAFTVLSENLNDIERGEAPKRTSEIDLNEGSLGVVDDTEFTITVEGSAPPAGTAPPPSGSDWTETVQTDAIRYSRDDATVIYENGATFRSTDPSGGSIVESKPELVCTENRAILSFVVLETDTNRELGSGTVRITGIHNTSEVLYPTGRNASASDGTAVRVGVVSPRQQGWRTYFIGDQENWEEPSPNTYECPDVDGIVIRKTVVDIEFTR